MQLITLFVYHFKREKNVINQYNIKTYEYNLYSDYVLIRKKCKQIETKNILICLH